MVHEADCSRSNALQQALCSGAASKFDRNNLVVLQGGGGGVRSYGQVGRRGKTEQRRARRSLGTGIRIQVKDQDQDQERALARASSPP